MNRGGLWLIVTTLVAAACGAGTTSSEEGIAVPASEPGSTVATVAEEAAGGANDDAGPEAPAGTAAPKPLEGGDVTGSRYAEEFTSTIPPAISQLGGNPVGGGGHPEGTIGELLSFTAPAVAGGELNGASLLGRDVVLWFWAPWCSWCNAEAPRVSAAASEFGGAVDIIGVAGVAGLEDMRSFVDRHGLGHLRHVADLDGSVWLDFDVTYQPWWIFINDDGSVLLNWQGRLGEEAIQDGIQTLIES